MIALLLAFFTDARFAYDIAFHRGQCGFMENAREDRILKPIRFPSAIAKVDHIMNASWFAERLHSDRDEAAESPPTIIRVG